MIQYYLTSLLNFSCRGLGTLLAYISLIFCIAHLCSSSLLEPRREISKMCVLRIHFFFMNKLSRNSCLYSFMSFILWKWSSVGGSLNLLQGLVYAWKPTMLVRKSKSGSWWSILTHEWLLLWEIQSHYVCCCRQPCSGFRSASIPPCRLSVSSLSWLPSSKNRTASLCWSCWGLHSPAAHHNKSFLNSTSGHRFSHQPLQRP